jgi:hypothetical protein
VRDLALATGSGEYIPGVEGFLYKVNVRRDHTVSSLTSVAIQKDKLIRSAVLPF